MPISSLAHGSATATLLVTWPSAGTASFWPTPGACSGIRRAPGTLCRKAGRRSCAAFRGFATTTRSRPGPTELCPGDAPARSEGFRASEGSADEASAEASAGPDLTEPSFPDVDGVRRAIRTLPPEQQAAIALFYLEEMSVAEVAVALDVPAGTVKTRLMHARRKLRGVLEGDE